MTDDGLAAKVRKIEERVVVCEGRLGMNPCPDHGGTILQKAKAADRAAEAERNAAGVAETARVIEAKSSASGGRRRKKSEGGIRIGLAVLAGLLIASVAVAGKIMVLHEANATHGTFGVYSDGSGTASVTTDVVHAKSKVSNAGTTVLSGGNVINGEGISTQTVAKSYYTLAPTAAYTQRMVNPSQSGTIVTFLNISNKAIVFVDGDSNIDLGGANIILGQTDILQLLGEGTVWYELGTVDN